MFLINVNSSLFLIVLLKNTIWISWKYFLRLFKMLPNQRESSKLEQRLSSIFWCQRSANHVKFREVCQTSLCQTSYYYKPESKRRILHWKYIDSQERTKFWAQQSVKIMLIVFRDMQGPITMDSLEEAADVNSAFYCQHLGQNWPYLLEDPRVCICI